MNVASGALVLLLNDKDIANEHFSMFQKESLSSGLYDLNAFFIIFLWESGQDQPKQRDQIIWEHKQTGEHNIFHTKSSQMYYTENSN